MSPSSKWTTRESSPMALSSIGLSDVQKAKKSLSAIGFARAGVVQERCRKLCHAAFPPLNSPRWPISPTFSSGFPRLRRRSVIAKWSNLAGRIACRRCFPSVARKGNRSATGIHNLLGTVHYVPDEKELVRSVEGDLRRGKIPDHAAKAIADWGRQTDFLRLYQAAYVGARLSPGAHLHAHFAGMAARTAYWIRQFFNVPFSFTAHANDVFVPRSFAIGLIGWSIPRAR